MKGKGHMDTISGRLLRGDFRPKRIVVISLAAAFALLTIGCAGGAGTTTAPAAAPTTTQLSIATTTLSAPVLGTSYNDVIQTNGGTPPVKFSISDGALPPGLALDAKSGTLSGKPTQLGAFGFKVTASDSGSPSPSSVTQSYKLTVAAGTDPYGGLTALPSPNGSTGYFRLEKFGSRWLFVTPDGNGMFSTAVSLVTPTALGSDQSGNTYPVYVQQKYAVGQGPNDGFTDWKSRWAWYTRARLQSWGFNTIGTFSYYPAIPDYSTDPATLPPLGNRPSNLMPHWVTKRNAGDAMRYGAVKNIYGPIFSQFWTPYFPDVFDPRFVSYVQSEASKSESWGNSSWVLAVFMDQTDQMRGVEATHPHLGFVVAATNFQEASDPNAYGGAQTYTDTRMYSKYALQSFLESEYNGDITKLNAAWGTSYTTWDDNGGWGTGTGFLDESGAGLGTAWKSADPQKAGYPAVRADLDAFAVTLMRQFYSTVYNAYKQYKPHALLATNNMSTPKPYVYQGLMSVDGTQVYADLITVGNDPNAAAAYAALKRPFYAALPYATAENDSPLGVKGTVDAFTFDDTLNGGTAYITCTACNFWWAGNPNYKLNGYVLLQFSSLPTMITQGSSQQPQFFRVMKWISPTQVAVAQSSYFNGTYSQLKAALKAGDTFKRVVYFHPEGPFDTQEARAQGYGDSVTQLANLRAADGDAFYVGVNHWDLADEGWVSYFEAYNFGLVTMRDNAYDGVQAVKASGTDSWGFAVGGEADDYGDFLGGVRSAHDSVLQEIVGGN
jgi:hypothetical protein